MIWIAAIPPFLALLVALALAPYEAVARARRLAVRADGSRSQRRADEEGGHLRRALVRGVVGPVAVFALAAAAMVGVHEWVPRSPAAELFGGNTPETAGLSAELVREYEERVRAAERARAERGDAPPPPVVTPGGVLLEHFPLHLIFVVAVAAGLWRLHGHVLAVRADYEHGVYRRARRYRRRDRRGEERPTGTVIA